MDKKTKVTKTTGASVAPIKGKAKAGGVVADMAVGAGIIAAMAGAYFMYGAKDAAKNRKKVKGWVLKAKGEVVEKLEKVQHATQEQYEATVDTVLNKYQAVKNIDLEEVDSLRKDLKKHWRGLQAEVKKLKKA
jgi:hypothetical protein